MNHYSIQYWSYISYIYCDHEWILIKIHMRSGTEFLTKRTVCTNNTSFTSPTCSSKIHQQLLISPYTCHFIYQILQCLHIVISFRYPTIYLTLLKILSRTIVTIYQYTSWWNLSWTYDLLQWVPSLVSRPVISQLTVSGSSLRMIYHDNYREEFDSSILCQWDAANVTQHSTCRAQLYWHICDYQRVIETTTNSRWCGCCSMKTRRSNILTTHDIKFSYKNGADAFSTKDLWAWSSVLFFKILVFPFLHDSIILKKLNRAKY